MHFTVLDPNIDSDYSHQHPVLVPGFTTLSLTSEWDCKSISIYKLDKVTFELEFLGEVHPESVQSLPRVRLSSGGCLEFWSPSGICLELVRSLPPCLLSGQSGAFVMTSGSQLKVELQQK